VRDLADEQTSVARAILQQLDHIPTVLILSQDSFYRRHTPEEIKLAFDNDLDLGELLARSSGDQKLTGRSS
jgi:uridine kinase